MRSARWCHGTIYCRRRLLKDVRATLLRILLLTCTIPLATTDTCTIHGSARAECALTCSSKATPLRRSGLWGSISLRGGGAPSSEGDAGRVGGDGGVGLGGEGAADDGASSVYSALQALRSGGGDSFQRLASGDSLLLNAAGVGGEEEVDEDVLRKAAVPLAPLLPSAPRMQAAEPHPTNSSTPQPRVYTSRLGGGPDEGEGEPWREPLPIPKDASGADVAFFRWLQERFMGEALRQKLRKVEHHEEDRAAGHELRKVEHHEEDRAAGHGTESTDAAGEASWFKRMEKTQADIAGNPDSAYNAAAFLNEDPHDCFPDAATEELWWACVEGNVEDAGEALAGGALVNFTHVQYHLRTPLHYAAARSDVDDAAVRLLIAAAADVNAVDEVGCRPLHFAAESFDPDKVRALVEAGAEKHHTNGHDCTPLQIARQMYDACADPKLEPNPHYDPKWEIEMMELLTYEGACQYRQLWPLHSAEIAAGDEARLAAGARPRPAVPPPELNHGIPLPKPTAAGASGTPQP